ncbi:MAG TPA: hypothetical protein PK453_09365 [Leptospiraceae bacterium]|nr:hypothetical protein [Leptospiraceae bacterium]HMY68556.1 hypothetical protein [Leptospiraceae bacterium]HNF13866.1 hypothetical protein [Leptospiraceae bacterium]HNF24865.1 hypothetical protein [Leptospiraceae bacterium]HNH09126.1 hypothetical protein [Leptospiraceae bacterium]
MHSVERKIRIDSPLPVVLDIMLDWNSYNRFLPSIDSFRVLSHDRKECRVETETVARLPVFGTVVKTAQTIIYDLETLTFQTVDRSGFFKEFKGFRKLEPDGDSVIFYSRVDYVYSSSFLDFLNQNIRNLIEKNVTSLQDSMKLEAEKRRSEKLTLADLKIKYGE